MIVIRELVSYLRSIPAVRLGLTPRDKVQILINRLLIATYPLNSLWYEAFGEPLIEPRKLIRGYKCRYGNAIFFCPGGNSEIQFLDHWEPEVKRIMPKLANGNVVDVGSNLGFYTIMLSRLLPHGSVFSIEPDPIHFEWLRKNVEINHCQNVTTMNIAAWSRATRLKLSRSVFGGSPMDSSMSVGKKFQFSVEARPLDDVFKEAGIKPRLIKIDVEGAEFEVLQGAQDTLRRATPSVIFEALNRELLHACCSLLEPLDYEIAPLDQANFLATPIGLREFTRNTHTDTH